MALPSRQRANFVQRRRLHKQFHHFQRRGDKTVDLFLAVQQQEWMNTIRRNLKTPDRRRKSVLETDKPDTKFCCFYHGARVYSGMAL